MLQLGLRLGAHPRALVTTTPRAGPVLTRIMDEPGCVTTGGATRANPHLPPAFVETMERLYGGTRLGEQELEGRLITDAAGALWTVEVLERCRAQGSGCAAIGSQCVEPSSAGQPAARSDDRTDVTNPLCDGLFPPHSTLSRSGRGRWTRIVIGVDPPAGDGTCGIVACALDEEGVGHVLANHSVTARSPEGWARAVAEAARQWGEEAARPERRMVRPVEGRWPERTPYGYGAIPEPPAELTFAAPVLIVAEQNQGRAMVRSVLHAADAALRVKLVSASTAKSARAEPVAMLFEQGRVRLQGPKLLMGVIRSLAGLIRTIDPVVVEGSEREVSEAER